MPARGMTAATREMPKFLVTAHEIKTHGQGHLTLHYTTLMYLLDYIVYGVLYVVYRTMYWISYII